MTLTGLTVAIIGGGIGGTAAAAALARRGAQVTLYEQASALTEVGAGLQVSANGQAVLRALGVVGATPPDRASVSSGTVFRDGRSGRFVAKVPPPKAGRTWYMHRADLLDLLVQVAQAAGVSTVLDRVVTPGTIEADVIVAADGAHSIWRSGIDGPDSPRFTGQVAWRAVVPQTTTPEEVAATLSMGRKAHVVHYPLRANKLMNVVAIEERRDWTAESWSHEGDVSEFQRRFRDFSGPAAQAIRAAERVHMWALHARPVAGTWVKGNTALLGDAAHPTLPFMAQGACLALEDAWVLADALSASADVDSALHLYQAKRQKRAQNVVALADGNAWRFHLGRPLAWGAHAFLKLGAGYLAQRLEWVYGYDPTTVIAAEV